MDAGGISKKEKKEIIVKILEEWIFTVETQSGEKLLVIDKTDFKEIAIELINKINPQI